MQFTIKYQQSFVGELLTDSFVIFAKDYLEAKQRADDMMALDDHVLWADVEEYHEHKDKR